MVPVSVAFFVDGLTEISGDDYLIRRSYATTESMCVICHIGRADWICGRPASYI